jgi:two-component system sensor histidine kinase BaeS
MKVQMMLSSAIRAISPRTLATKLTLAFLLVSLTGTALVAILVGQITTSEFDKYLLDQMQSSFVAQASQYYQANGSWLGASDGLRGTESFSPLAPASRATGSTGSSPPAPVQLARSQRRDNPFLLADRDGYTVVSAGPYRIGERVPTSDLAKGAPVDANGRMVGTAIFVGALLPRDPKEDAYLAQTGRAIVVGAVGGTAVALILAIVLAATLTRPLRELTAATRAVAKGEVHQVTVRSRDELGQLAASFNQMSADLASSAEARRQMTADIAHDLRTPLTVMTGYLESLRDGVLKPTPARFEVMYNEARHLQRLVEDLRTLSLADAGELPLNRQPESPRALMERAAAAFRQQAEQKGIALEVQAADGLPTIRVDAERMMQVMGNLLTNALRYTPGGGGIRLLAEPGSRQVSITVRDSGVGISADALPHVFDRFYRGDGSRQDSDGESGLGLAIARSLVNAQGGEIRALSEPGQGTAFVMVFPT